MQKSIASFIFLLLSGLAFSQVNAYFSNDPVWRVKHINYSGTDGSHNDEEFNYYINGDTIISTLVYKKVYRKGIVSYFSSMGAPLGSNTFVETLPFFYVRSAAKKMYILDPGGTEVLLCDYNLAPGDTVAGSITSMTTGIYTVVSTDSINTSSGYRKIFTLSGTTVYPGSNPPVLLEGAGSSAGLTEDLSGAIGVSNFSELICYSQNNTSYFPSAGPGCELALKTTDYDNWKQAVIYPNPFSGSTTFEFNTTIEHAFLNVYNLNGEKWRSISFSGNTVILNRENLPAGFYFYDILSDQQFLSKGKLIVID